MTLRAANIATVHGSLNITDCPVDPTPAIAPLTANAIHQFGQLDLFLAAFAEAVVSF
jgi:hypothetical protein